MIRPRVVAHTARVHVLLPGLVSISSIGYPRMDTPHPEGRTMRRWLLLIAAAAFSVNGLLESYYYTSDPKMGLVFQVLGLIALALMCPPCTSASPSSN